MVCEALSRLRAEGLSPAARWLAKELKRLKGTRGAAPPRLLWLSGVLQNPMRGESAPAGGEDVLFRLAAQLEKAQPWMRKAPEV